VARHRLVLILGLLLPAAAGVAWLALRTPAADFDRQFQTGLAALERGRAEGIG
jgi:hypothetical protein